VNWDELARSTEDFNGAQMKAVCVEAGMLALRREASELCHEGTKLATLSVSCTLPCALYTPFTFSPLDPSLIPLSLSCTSIALLSLTSALLPSLHSLHLHSLHSLRRIPDFMEGIAEVQAKKKATLQYYA
jgi:SpoVK/Ycf46/Vps4 family AAA+-type ATPase